MAIIPTLHCRNLARSLAFYTEVLDFRHVGGEGRTDDPAMAVLARGDGRLILSSHSGDGAFGQAVVVTTVDLDVDARRFRARGLVVPPDVAARSPVHAAPLTQTWGTREWYVDDPDGHTLRFVQGWSD